METQEINNLLTQALGTVVFKGVFPASQLPVIPQKIRYPWCIVCNTDGQGPGMHWVCMYFDENHIGHYFDSFGSYPYHKEWCHYLSAMSFMGIWDYFKVSVQPVDSALCGAYVIYYLIKRHTTPLHVSDYVLMNNVSPNAVRKFVETLT
jgi:hypothetical protein